jgi:hypothetical protein
VAHAAGVEERQTLGEVQDLAQRFGHGTRRLACAGTVASSPELKISTSSSRSNFGDQSGVGPHAQRLADEVAQRDAAGAISWA